MSLEVIYLVRHGFRTSWVVDPATGEYTATVKSPTGLPADPPLTSHGVEQAKELAARLMTVQPPIDQVYSSPYYRCLQTVEPFMKLRAEQQRRSGSRIDTSFTSRPAFEVRCETGLSDWYGTAPFEHPTSAPPGKLKELFPFLDESYSTVLEPTRRGESIARLHDRVAACLQGIVEQCDKHGHRAVLLCAHAAINIAAGRVLTGVMPEDVETEDFGAFTCGLSVFRRRPLSSGAQKRQGGSVSGDGPDALPGRDISDSTGVGVAADEPVGPSAPRSAATDGNRGRSIPDEALAGPRIAKWADGRGVGGGFDCLVNCDCSHLSGGEERGWRFGGDESFAQGDPLDLGVVVERTSPGRVRQRSSGSPRL